MKDTRDRIRIIILLLAAAALILPAYSSVLCVAPGAHVAIESLNALCCSSSHLSSSEEHSSKNGLSDGESCHGCTDLLLSDGARISGSTPSGAGAGSLNSGESDAGLVCNPLSVASLKYTGARDSGLPLHASSAPLRC